MPTTLSDLLTQLEAELTAAWQARFAALTPAQARIPRAGFFTRLRGHFGKLPRAIITLAEYCQYHKLAEAEVRAAPRRTKRRRSASLLEIEGFLTAFTRPTLPVAAVV